MQEVYNAAWYAGNEEVKYPLDSDASGYSDSGDALPTSLISDLRIVTTNKKNLRIAGVTCSEHLISVVIASGSDMIAALSVPQPVKPYTHYAMESFSGDATGVIAFGHTDNYGQWRFSSPNQSGLAPTCQIVLNPWPVTSFADSLRGDITLTQGAGIKIDVEDRIIGKRRLDNSGKHVKAIVIRGHAASTGASSTAADTMFLGKCATRPDNSDNSPTSQCRYILTVGDATPDEYGNIDVKVVSELPELKVGVSTEVSGNVSTECGTTLTDCNVLVITGSQEKEERPPMEFGKQGEDQCEKEEEEGGETPQGHARSSQKSFKFRYVNLREETYPTAGEALECDNETGLTHTGSEPATVSADVNCTFAAATFTLIDGGVCGFKWGNNNTFLYNGINLSLNEQTIERICYGTITMELEVRDDIVSARLYRNDILLAALSEPGSALENLSLYLLHDYCTQWRIG